MSLLFVDSFDHYSTPQLLNKWTQGSSFLINNTLARTGGQCLEVSATGIFKTLPNRSVWIIGGACQWDGFGGGFAVQYISSGQAQIGLLGDGTFSGGSGTVGGGTQLGRSDPSAAVHLNRYYYLEVMFTIGVSGGIVIRLNGQTILNLSGVNTDPNGTGVADVVQIWGPGGGSHMFVDDFYVCDNLGSKNTTFLGDTQIGLIMPVSDGHYTQFTPSPAGSHFSNVNEIPPDGDATYNFDSNPGDIDSYKFQSVDTTRTYFGIQTNITARKDDTGNRSLSPMTRIGGVDFVKDPSPNDKFVNQTYIDYTDTYDTNPATGLSWTGSDINGAEYGVKVIS